MSTEADRQSAEARNASDATINVEQSVGTQNDPWVQDSTWVRSQLELLHRELHREVTYLKSENSYMWAIFKELHENHRRDMLELKSMLQNVTCGISMQNATLQNQVKEMLTTVETKLSVLDAMDKK